MTEPDTPRVDTTPPNRRGLFAALGMFGALLASACCIVPLVLVTLGISGAWISNLTALEPYKPLTSGIAIFFIAAGFWHVYFRARPDCADGSYCAKPQSSLITKTALWAATLLVLLSITVNWWAPLFY
ncbi:mercury transporter MerT [Defluviimonas sp. 20V17]|uniref:Mercuric transport protein MerT n=1 Tax=Allgaiera indica TaxID=765699 RepID=A0AAN5A196_9RHOB|nr:mercuric transporter MerT family protein [Allgaiera indica]KDB01678.1 mercury transporter MerT [Defluviimonas sp. 20V17]GHE03962.1 mercury transporter [Allgaiera indica]SDX34962.1 mercuric ion transport protein [Allgaiera indica]